MIICGRVSKHDINRHVRELRVCLHILTTACIILDLVLSAFYYILFRSDKSCWVITTSTESALVNIIFCLLVLVRCFHCWINGIFWPSIVSCRHVLFCLCGSRGQQGSHDYPLLLLSSEDTKWLQIRAHNYKHIWCTAHTSWCMSSHVSHPCSNTFNKPVPLVSAQTRFLNP